MSVHCVRVRSDAQSRNRKVRRSVCSAANLSQSRAGCLKNSTFCNGFFIEGHSFVVLGSSEEAYFGLLDFSASYCLTKHPKSISFLSLVTTLKVIFDFFHYKEILKVNQEPNVWLFCCSFLFFSFFFSKNTVWKVWYRLAEWCLTRQEFSVQWVQEKC